MSWRPRTLVSLVGTLTVSAYATVLVLQTRVWNPQALVARDGAAVGAPSTELADIHAYMASQGEFLMPGFAIALGIIGILLAIGLLVQVLLFHVHPARAALGYLGLIVLGAPAYVAASFGPGMALADAYWTGGYDVAPYGEYLLNISGAALAVTAVLASFLIATTLRRDRALRQAASAPEPRT